MAGTGDDDGERIEDDDNGDNDDDDDNGDDDDDQRDFSALRFRTRMFRRDESGQTYTKSRAQKIEMRFNQGFRPDPQRPLALVVDRHNAISVLDVPVPLPMPNAPNYIVEHDLDVLLYPQELASSDGDGEDDGEDDGRDTDDNTQGIAGPSTFGDKVVVAAGHGLGHRGGGERESERRQRGGPRDYSHDGHWAGRIVSSFPLLLLVLLLALLALLAAVTMDIGPTPWRRASVSQGNNRKYCRDELEYQHENHPLLQKIEHISILHRDTVLHGLGLLSTSSQKDEGDVDTRVNPQTTTTINDINTNISVVASALEFYKANAGLESLLEADLQAGQLCSTLYRVLLSHELEEDGEVLKKGHADGIPKAAYFWFVCRQLDYHLTEMRVAGSTLQQSLVSELYPWFLAVESMRRGVEAAMDVEKSKSDSGSGTKSELESETQSGFSSDFVDEVFLDPRFVLVPWRAGLRLAQQLGTKDRGRHAVLEAVCTGTRFKLSPSPGEKSPIATVLDAYESSLWYVRLGKDDAKHVNTLCGIRPSAGAGADDNSGAHVNHNINRGKEDDILCSLVHLSDESPTIHMSPEPLLESLESSVQQWWLATVEIAQARHQDKEDNRTDDDNTEDNDDELDDELDFDPCRIVNDDMIHVFPGAAVLVCHVAVAHHLVSSLVDAAAHIPPIYITRWARSHERFWDSEQADTNDNNDEGNDKRGRKTSPDGKRTLTATESLRDSLSGQGRRVLRDKMAIAVPVLLARLRAWRLLEQLRDDIALLQLQDDNGTAFIEVIGRDEDDLATVVRHTRLPGLEIQAQYLARMEDELGTTLHKVEEWDRRYKNSRHITETWDLNISYKGNWDINNL